MNKENVFIVEQKSFAALLAAMQPICTKRTTIDATSYLHISVGHRELVVKGTDLEVSLQASYLVKESSGEQIQPFLVSGKRLFDIVRELEGSITCVLEHNQLILHSGAARLSLHIRDAQDFPPFPERIENL